MKAQILGAAMLAAAIAATAGDFKSERTDFRDETIYFAMTTRFYDGDPTNNVCGWDHQNVQVANNDPDWRGDFKGLIDKLDYIKALGFTAVWITPVVQNCSGTDFHGYHAMDFSTVDLRYESRREWGADEDVSFQDLIDAAHARDMKIVLDIVLNHTGNFGEARLAPLFRRSSDIRNQASPATALIPNYELLPADYNSLDGNAQYHARFPYLKNSDGTNKDHHNYWHHVGTGWNWDLPNRWYGQIAGDCVDLNTENPAVARYLVECYGKFIEMGVDGFRIDTTGHISRLTFNTSFIPQFLALGEQYAHKRLNGAPFFMFGECCARFSDVTYRDQPNLSSYFYTWKSAPEAVAAWDDDATFWDNIFIREGDDAGRYGNMALCDAEPSVKRYSDNALMQSGAWHEPDYSDYSGFSVIDFPMHYNFNNASAAVNIARSGDRLYNDASFNVVYVDSHDYCPGPNDGTRFNGGTAQWAENLSLMFTFRGIPCIYYGSEVEFQAGKKVDAGGTDMPVKDSGRAYFGHYLEGTVNATDFGRFTASGPVAATLDADLARHIICLNRLRAAVPALRKGQYTFDGCTPAGGYAFKRAYRDSYALVAINGGATFTGVPTGNYTDIVTGRTYTGGGTIKVDAPAGKGQLRVLVKDWTGGRLVDDTRFIFDTTPAQASPAPVYDDPGASAYYTADDAPGQPAVVLSPAGGAFTTPTIAVEASLNAAAASGSYTVGAGSPVALEPGSASTFTLGTDMAFGESVQVSWTASSASGEVFHGTATYRKADPDASITVYVSAAEPPTLYAWGKNSAGASVEPCGAWPGKLLTDKCEAEGREWYSHTFTDMDAVNIIFSHNGAQTPDITGITADAFYDYDGATVAVPSFGSPVEPGETITVYYDNSVTAWQRVLCHHWGSPLATSWPGETMTFASDGTRDFAAGYTQLWMHSIPAASTGVVFNNGAGDQTADITPEDGRVYRGTGNRGFDTGEIISGIAEVTPDAAAPALFYNLQGMPVARPESGHIYIMCSGGRATKVMVK